MARRRAYSNSWSNPEGLTSFVLPPGFTQCSQILFFVNTLDILAVFGVYAYDVAFVDKEGSVQRRARFERYKFRAPLGGVSFDRGRGLGDLELHFDGDLDADYLFIKHKRFHYHVGFQKLPARTDGLRREHKAVCRVILGAEPTFAFVGIEILYVFSRKVGLLYFFRDMESLLGHLAGDKVAQFGLVDRLAHLLAG